MATTQSRVKKIIVGLLVIAAPVMVIFCAGVGLFLYCYFNSIPQAEKFMMPGRYKVMLRNGDYALLVYPIWKSKNIDAQLPMRPRISIAYSDGTKVTQDSSQAEAFTKLSSSSFSPERGGSIVSTFELKRSEEYTISSPDYGERFVIALVPANAHYCDLGSNQRFEGDDQDLHFHELPSGQ